MAGGTTETITGTNLTGATAVDFGTTKATGLKVVSSTKITATIPKASKAGMVDVKVVTAGGTSAVVSGDEFTTSPRRQSPASARRRAWLTHGHDHGRGPAQRHGGFRQVAGVDHPGQ